MYEGKVVDILFFKFAFIQVIKKGCVHSMIGTLSNSYQESMPNIRNGWMEIGNRISASAWMSFHISDKQRPCVDAHA